MSDTNSIVANASTPPPIVQRFIAGIVITGFGLFLIGIFWYWIIMRIMLLHSMRKKNKVWATITKKTVDTSNESDRYYIEYRLCYYDGGPFYTKESLVEYSVYESSYIGQQIEMYVFNSPIAKMARTTTQPCFRPHNLWVFVPPLFTIGGLLLCYDSDYKLFPIGAFAMVGACIAQILFSLCYIAHHSPKKDTNDYVTPMQLSITVEKGDEKTEEEMETKKEKKDRKEKSIEIDISNLAPIPFQPTRPCLLGKKCSLGSTPGDIIVRCSAECVMAIHTSCFKQTPIISLREKCPTPDCWGKIIAIQDNKSNENLSTVKMDIVSPPIQSNNYIPDNSLPNGWEARIDPRDGKTYFLNHMTKQTTYEDPRPLPPGWEAQVDYRDGRTYFLDHNTKKTTFDDPRPKISKV